MDLDMQWLLSTTSHEDGPSDADEDQDGQGEEQVAPPPNRLPYLIKHAATARESDSDKQERLHQLSGALDVQRIRYAPPPVANNDPHNDSKSDEIFLPRLTFAAAQRETDSAEKLRVLKAMETHLSSKQTETARYFRILYELQQQSTSGSMKALLQQIFTVLFRATYSMATNSNATMELETLATEVDPAALDELAGHEYYSLFTHAQQTLEVVSSKKQQLETNLEMERKLEQELVAVLHVLDADLHHIRTQHLENHERVEAERAAVAQLEEDHAALIHQEQVLHKECDGLQQQADKQHAQLEELQSKSAYLDFISRIPLKKHLEQKKLKDQEDALAAVVHKEEAENEKLEQELAKLNDQLVELGNQYETDVIHRTHLESELHEATKVRDLTQSLCQRLRDCHTPRPAWELIVDKIPELATDDDIEWDELDAAQGNSPSVMLRRAEAAAKLDACGGHGGNDNHLGYEDGIDTGKADDYNEDDYSDDDDEDDEDDASVGGQTQQLVKEILQWIERLQKHCGVNLHLNRIWHDVEEARVELNILQHQLDRAVCKYGGGGSNSSSRRGPNAAASLSSCSSSSSSPSKQKQKQEYICALGIHAEIPLFLRHQGKVKRHLLKKNELDSLVRKVWVEKRQREKRNPHLRLPLDEVLYETLHRKYGFQPLIAEWGYNILISLDSFVWDAEIELFLLCLTNALSESIFVDQEQMIDKCQSLLLTLSQSYHNESFVAERRVLLKDALVGMRKFFPLKTSIQLQTLEKAMIRDMHKMKRGGNDSILYIDDILPKNVNYPRGFFVKAIRTQHFKEIQEYYTHLTTELESRDEHKTGELPLHQVREAMLGVDPLTDQNAVWSALLRGVGVKRRGQLEMHEPIQYKPLLRRMNTTGLLKFALNYDINAEQNWHRRGPMDLALVGGGTKRNSRARLSIMAIRAKSRPPSAATSSQNN